MKARIAKVEADYRSILGAAVRIKSCLTGWRADMEQPYPLNYLMNMLTKNHRGEDKGVRHLRNVINQLNTSEVQAFAAMVHKHVDGSDYDLNAEVQEIDALMLEIENQVRLVIEAENTGNAKERELSNGVYAMRTVAPGQLIGVRKALDDAIARVEV